MERSSRQWPPFAQDQLRWLGNPRSKPVRPREPSFHGCPSEPASHCPRAAFADNSEYPSAPREHGRPASRHLSTGDAWSQPSAAPRPARSPARHGRDADARQRYPQARSWDARRPGSRTTGRRGPAQWPGLHSPNHQKGLSQSTSSSSGADHPHAGHVLPNSDFQPLSLNNR